MAGKQRRTPAKSKSQSHATKADAHDDAANIYKDMLAEALPAQTENERPLKRRKVGYHRKQASNVTSAASPSHKHESEEDDNDVEFEDVPTTFDLIGGQTAYRSDDESDSEAATDGEVDLDLTINKASPFGDLDLTLNKVPQPSHNTTTRRRAITGLEKSLRLEVHKVHILCLLSHVSRRNDWCNDLDVHKSLKVLLDRKMIQFLNPPETLSQFGRTDSLKRGLEMVSTMWRKKFTITARGLRRSLWADDPEDLEKVSYLPTLDRFKADA
jgi:xeroderma pigmentosum group C-complementing protein